MGWDKPAAEPPGERGEGCLAVAIRLPVRLVAFGLILPVRLVWDAVLGAGRAGRTGLRWVWRRVLGPALLLFGRYVVVWPLTRLFLHVAVPFARVVVIPAARAAWITTRFLWRRVAVPSAKGIGAALGWTWQVLVLGTGRGLAWLWRVLAVPSGRGIAAVLGFLVRYLLVIPLGFLWQRVVVALARVVGAGLAWVWRVLLVPSGRGIAAACVFLVRYGLVVPVGFLVTYLLVVPSVFLWHRVVVPVAREVWDGLGLAWRATAFVSRAVGRGLAWLFHYAVVLPVAWIWRATFAPAGRALRAAGRWWAREVWRPVREGLADARRAVWRPIGAGLSDARRAVGRALRPIGEGLADARESVRRALRAPKRQERPKVPRQLVPPEPPEPTEDNPSRHGTHH